MSDTNVFEGDNPNPTKSEDNNPQSAAPEIPEDLKDFIGEGKKYRTLEDALKSVPHAQSHISNLERELAELKEDLNKRLSAEEVLKKIQEGRKQEEGKPAESSVDPDALKNLVKETFSEMTREERVQANIKAVDSKLKEKLGEKAGDFIKQKATELGVSIDFLKDAAAQSPNAFYSLVGLNLKQEVTNQSRQSDVNSANLEQTAAVKPHTYRWYQQMRKENPKDYYSAKVQLEMHKRASEMGSDFYN